MSRFLVTFSGKFGDALWSLPTAKAISEMMGEKVDFACMPPYKSLLPLVAYQPYIDKAFVIDDWCCVNSNYGDQPWHPPSFVEKDYAKCWHLAYRSHPGLNGVQLPLVDFIAYQQGIRFRESPVPFLTVPDVIFPNLEDKPFFAYAFNEQYAPQKEAFLKSLLAKTKVGCINVGKLSWLAAGSAIKQAFAFVGCRSANYVLAHGVGARILCYEPHPARTKTGHLGHIFGCPYGRETDLPFALPTDVLADIAVSTLNEWRIEEEAKNAYVET